MNIICELSTLQKQVESWQTHLHGRWLGAKYKNWCLCQISVPFWFIETHAINAEYWTVLSIILLTLLFYDASIDGALEFYNRLYSADYPQYNQHTLYCAGNEGLYNDEYENVVRDESFNEYDLGLDECDNFINVDEDVGVCVPSDTIENEDVSEMISIISGCIFLIISLIMA